MREITITLTNTLGLHARPASKLVKTAARYKSRIMLYGNNKSADAKSISMVMSMGLPMGTQLKIQADGQDQDACISALQELVENKFYEE